MSGNIHRASVLNGLGCSASSCSWSTRHGNGRGAFDNDCSRLQGTLSLQSALDELCRAGHEGDGQSGSCSTNELLPSRQTSSGRFSQKRLHLAS
ncbi:hypothetical protein Mapa_011834 [Marchantia paleacea]|nr:hypothetical protein Mapa_011834 [Marchantia paleacea]